MYLLDTDVLSLTSPTSRLSTTQAESWRGWVTENREQLFFSAVTILEIQFGIEKLEGRGATVKAKPLRRWLFGVEHLFTKRIVPIDPPVARRAGELLHRAVVQGHQPSSEDALIAAPADLLGYTLISRNLRHMEPMGVTAMDPLAALP